MGCLDYAGLQYLWGKLKEKFAPKSHSHDDRYYTETEIRHIERVSVEITLNTVLCFFSQW